MCLAVPAQLVAVNDAIGTVELTGATRDCSLLLVPEAKVGVAPVNSTVPITSFTATNCAGTAKHILSPYILY